METLEQFGKFKKCEHMCSAYFLLLTSATSTAFSFGLGFRELDYKSAFLLMGLSILGSSLLSVFITIEGHAGIMCGEDKHVDAETGKLLEELRDEEDELENAY